MNMPILKIADEIEDLTYDANSLKPGWVHIGWGKFATGHIGHYAHDMAKAGFKDFGLSVIGPSDRLKRHFNEMRERNFLYYILRRNGHEICTPIGAVRDALTGQYRQQEVIERLASPATKLVSLTVEKDGYCIDDTYGIDERALAGDIKALQAKDWQNVKTVPGWLAAGLYLRYAERQNPFVVMSCDNHMENGTVLGKVVTYLAENMRDAGFTSYLRDEVLFPNTMVDRITPVQDYDRQRAYLNNKHHVDDLMPLICEEHRELAVDDPEGRLPADIRAAFKAVDIEITQNIAAFQDRKICLLNAPHSVIGVIGTMRRYDQVAPMFRDGPFKEFLHRGVYQTAAALERNGIENCYAYAEKTLKRFENTLIPDNVSRLIRNITSKINPRLTNFWAVACDMPADISAFNVAATIKFLGGRDDSENPFNLHADDIGALTRHGLTDHRAPEFHDNLADFLIANEPTKQLTLSDVRFQTYIRDIGGHLERIVADGLRPAMITALEQSKRGYALSPV